MLKTRQSHSKAYKLSLSPICPNLAHFLPKFKQQSKKDTSPLHLWEKNKKTNESICGLSIPYGQDTAIAIDVLSFHTIARQDLNLLGVDCQYPLDSTQPIRAVIFRQQLFGPQKKGGNMFAGNIATKKNVGKNNT